MDLSNLSFEELLDLLVEEASDMHRFSGNYEEAKVAVQKIRAELCKHHSNLLASANS